MNLEFDVTEDISNTAISYLQDHMKKGLSVMALSCGRFTREQCIRILIQRIRDLEEELNNERESAGKTKKTCC